MQTGSVSKSLTRSAVLATTVFLVLSVLLAIPFWISVLRALPTPPSTDPGKATVFLVVMLLSQLLSVAYLGWLAKRAGQDSLLGLSVIAVLGSGAFLLASVVSYFFTPGLGLPMTLLILVAGFVSQMAYMSLRARRRDP